MSEGLFWTVHHDTLHCWSSPDRLRISAVGCDTHDVCTDKDAQATCTMCLLAPMICLSVIRDEVVRLFYTQPCLRDVNIRDVGKGWKSQGSTAAVEWRSQDAGRNPPACKQNREDAGQSPPVKIYARNYGCATRPRWQPRVGSLTAFPLECTRNKYIMKDIVGAYILPPTPQTVDGFAAKVCWSLILVV